MKKELIITIILAIPALNGCGIYTHYQRPEGLPTDSLYRDIPAGEDTTSLASLSWRELFSDPQLVKWIELGLEQNTDLQTAQLKVEEAEATLLSAKLAFLPSVSLSPEGSLSSFDGSKATKTYNLGASASWELDIFGSQRNAKESARALLEQSKAYQQAVQTQLIATIADTYYSLLKLDKQLIITRQTVENWQKNVRMTSALKRAGQADEAAVTQAEANRLEAEASILTLERQIHELENSFSTLLGMVPGDIERGEISNQDFPADMSVGIPLQLVSKRPDIRQAEYNLASAFYATNQARSAFYPSIVLGGSAGWTNSAGSMIINPGKFLATAIGSLTQPLFNRGANIAQLKIAKAQQEEAKLSFQQALLNAGSEVNDALVKYQTARDKAGLFEKQIASLEKAYESTSLTMLYGNTTYLEVLTAQQSLLSAQLTQVANRFMEIQGVINLYQALGGGRE